MRLKWNVLLFLQQQRQQKSIAQVRGLASTSGGGDCAGVLLREHIKRSLSDPVKGYFIAQADVVGTLRDPLDFNSLLGKSGYDFKIQQEYRRTGKSWLTPVEIFQPHYGNAFARFIVEDFQERSEGTGEQLHICEIGAGNGTFACNVLQYVRDRHPEFYKDMQYSTVEVSSELCRRQTERIELFDRSHGSRFEACHFDATEDAFWRQLGNGHTYIVGLEVLDNLPHDRIENIDGRWMETYISYEEDTTEHLKDLSDPLIKRCFHAHEWMQGKRANTDLLSKLEAFIRTATGGKNAMGKDIIFLPTGTMALLESIKKYANSHTIILADFDNLPDVQIEGWNAPLVSQTIASKAVDFEDYLVPFGSADIFFPTDFDALCSMYANGIECKARHMSSRDFLERYADLQETTTLSGYNPLLEEFVNTRVFIGST